MIRDAVLLLMASVAATPNPPTGVSLSEVTSQVRVSWTNAGAYQTKVYRKKPYTTSTWTLVTTVNAGVSTYDTGDTEADSYTYGVSHLSGSQESSVTTATGLTPDTVTPFISTYGGA